LRYWELLEIKDYLAKFKRINSIHRVDFETLMIEFDRDEKIYFYMKRGESFIYKKEDDVRSNMVNSPFDTQLSSRFARSEIQNMEIINSDKILRIDVELSNLYKKSTSSLQFEFTGKHTNIVILEDGKVVEALHHISEFQSVRFVKVGEILENPPKPNIKWKSGEKIEDIQLFLREKYITFREKSLQKEILKERKKVVQRAEKLRNLLQKMPSEEEFLEQSIQMKNLGDLVLANLHNMRDYEKSIRLEDWNGDEVYFARPKEAKSNSHMARIFFHNSRRLRKKSENSKIERESLKDKVDFLEKLEGAINSAKSLNELVILSNRGEKEERGRKRRGNEERDSLLETFWIEGHKVLLGKSSKANQYLLENSKSGDLWLHLKDIPSAHVIIVTDRREVKEKIILEAGKLCIKFSVSESGKYLVDYAQRKFVRIQNGSNVLYTNYKTLTISI
jgi:predicted ribosome quality control (RQC) complex YloA/Tae2 family protein